MTSLSLLAGRTVYSTISDYFGVSETDGNVFVAKDLTRHVGTYTFDVRATDEYGSGPFSAFAKVTIDVLPSANTPPIILKPAKDNDTVEVLEVKLSSAFLVC